MPLFESEAPNVPPTSDARVAPRRPPRWLFPYSAVIALAIGLYIQVQTARVVITCRRDAGVSPSCTLEQRVLFNTLRIGRERVTGVQGARTSVRTDARGRPETATFVVVLDTAEGERDAGWSSQGEPANIVALAINEHIRTGVKSFKETVRPHFFDEMVRLFGLFWICRGRGPGAPVPAAPAGGDGPGRRVTRHEVG